MKLSRGAPIGTESLRTRSGVLQWFVKVSDHPRALVIHGRREWVAKSILTLESAGIALHPDYYPIFINGDGRDCRLENLLPFRCCSAPGCTKAVREDNKWAMCAFHSQRAEFGIPLDAPKRIQVKSKCTWLDCDRDHFANGLCGMHYQRNANGVDMNMPVRRRYSAGQVCKVDNCGEPVRTNEYCKFHYQRVYINGTVDLTGREYESCPIGTEAIKDGEIIVKVSQHPCMWKSGRDRNGNGWVKKKILVMETAGFKVSYRQNIYHIDGDKSNFALENLTFAKGLQILTCPIDGVVFAKNFYDAMRSTSNCCSRSCAAKFRWINRRLSKNFGDKANDNDMEPATCNSRRID